MRIKALARIVAWMALGVLVLGAKCPGVPGTDEIEMTLVTEEFIEMKFEARGTINVDSDSDTLSVREIWEDLQDAGINIDMVDSIRVASVQYGALTCDEGRSIEGDWVKIARGDNTPTTLITGFGPQPVCPLVGVLTDVPLEAGGIDTLNAIMATLLDKLKNNPDSEMVVEGSFQGRSIPESEDTHFDWRVRIYYHIVGRYLVEVPAF